MVNCTTMLFFYSRNCLKKSSFYCSFQPIFILLQGSENALVVEPLQAVFFVWLSSMQGIFSIR